MARPQNNLGPNITHLIIPATAERFSADRVTFVPPQPNAPASSGLSALARLGYYRVTNSRGEVLCIPVTLGILINDGYSH